MNPLTNVKNINKLNELELQKGLVDKKSWHDLYKDSAWIFIGGLAYGLTEGDILTVFSQYGEIVNINMVRDKKTGKTRGFCFLCYANQKSTVLAVDNFNGIKLCNRTIRVDHVANYRPPKDEDETVDILKMATSLPESQNTQKSSFDTEEVVPKKKKLKKEKKHKKRKKSIEQKNNLLDKKIKHEKHDPAYDKYAVPGTSSSFNKREYDSDTSDSSDDSSKHKKRKHEKSDRIFKTKEDPERKDIVRSPDEHSSQKQSHAQKHAISHQKVAFSKSKHDSYHQERKLSSCSTSSSDEISKSHKSSRKTVKCISKSDKSTNEKMHSKTADKERRHSLTSDDDETYQKSKSSSSKKYKNDNSEHMSNLAKPSSSSNDSGSKQSKNYREKKDSSKKHGHYEDSKYYKDYRKESQNSENRDFKKYDKDYHYREEERSRNYDRKSIDNDRYHDKRKHSYKEHDRDYYASKDKYKNK